MAAPSRPPSPRRSRRRLLFGAAALAAAGGGALGGCAALDRKQREWIFQPTERTWSAGVAAAQGMDDVWIDSRPAGGTDRADAPAAHAAHAAHAARLHGLWLARPEPDAPVLLYLHGARWDVRGSAPRMRRLHDLGFSVLAVDYRGFGRSAGDMPSEASAIEDAHAAWAWLAGRHPRARRFVFGHSLGAAIAVRLAAELAERGADATTPAGARLDGLIVEGAFPSIPDVVASFRWGFLPVGPLITQRFDAGARIAKVRAPVLIVHGSADALIPMKLGQALYERANEPKRFVVVDGGTHHDTNWRGADQYRQAVAELFGVRAPDA